MYSLALPPFRLMHGEYPAFQTGVVATELGTKRITEDYQAKAVVLPLHESIPFMVQLL